MSETEETEEAEAKTESSPYVKSSSEKARAKKQKKQKKREARQLKKAKKLEKQQGRRAAKQELQRRRRANKYPKAYLGDTYVYDLNKASKTEKPWLSFVQLAVLLTVAADFALLSSVFSYLFDTGQGGIKDFLLNYVVPLSTIVGYLVIGIFAGKKFREYGVLKRRSALVSAILFALLEFIVLLLITVVRYYSELAIDGAGATNAFTGGFGAATSGFSGGFGSQGFGASSQGFFEMLGLTFDKDALWCALMLSFVMVLGAILEMYHSYCSYDPFAAEKKCLAEAHIAEDRLLYEKVYFETASSSEKNAAYEERERELDRRTVNSAFRISELATQLNGIVDPADAYDFCTISRLANEGFFKGKN